ncbi:MAG TPA: glycosyltransferase family A protein [Solirubrobacteraceae bacterium]|jgi:glycosyltransferase involved in cell wall biosynthesis
MPLFTVFTATWQRAHTLHRVRDSLEPQTLRDFEWLVVDDGSTDGTDELVAGWAREASFPIRYVRQENAGKHVAWNRGVREARGELFLSLDSDDRCLPHALERFAHHWAAIPDRSRFQGVTALCQDPEGTVIGTPFPEHPLDTTPVDLRYRHAVTGEKWGFQRVDVLREHPFPEPEGQRFVPESLVWDRIGRRFLTRFVNEPLRIYDEQEDAPRLMTDIADPRPSAAAFAETFAEQLNEDLRYARYAPASFARTAANYARLSLHAGAGPVAQLRALRPAAWPLWAVGAPAGAAIYARDRRRLRR